MLIFNKKIDLLFINFPIIFPIIYCIILYAFPSFENLLIFTTLFLLAEPHFAATFPIFFNRINKDYIIKKRLSLIYGSILIVIFSIAGFFYFRDLFLIIFYFFNVFHVTRQSVGISNLYKNNEIDFIFQSNIIYFYNILFLTIGYLRFYSQSLNIDILNLNLIVISSIVLVVFVFSFISKSLKSTLTMLTGILIFYPVCFVENPVHVILMGVTMHYSQYLFITHKVDKGRNKFDQINVTDSISNFFKSKYFIFILIYAFFMTLFSLIGKSISENLYFLLLIPITGQMLHFYIDSFIWRFSDEHNRNVTLKHLLNK